jgi:hypothetical protein
MSPSNRYAGSVQRDGRQVLLDADLLNDLGGRADLVNEDRLAISNDRCMSICGQGHPRCSTALGGGNATHAATQQCSRYKSGNNKPHIVFPYLFTTIFSRSDGFLYQTKEPPIGWLPIMPVM